MGSIECLQADKSHCTAATTTTDWYDQGERARAREREKEIDSCNNRSIFFRREKSSGKQSSGKTERARSNRHFHPRYLTSKMHSTDHFLFCAVMWSSDRCPVVIVWLIAGVQSCWKIKSTQSVLSLFLSRWLYWSKYVYVFIQILHHGNCTFSHCCHGPATSFAGRW